MSRVKKITICQAIKPDDSAIVKKLCIKLEWMMMPYTELETMFQAGVNFDAIE